MRRPRRIGRSCWKRRSTIAVDGAPVRGPADARITLVEFSDFECPYCSAAVKQVDIVMAAYPKDVKLIYKQFPLSMHPHAELAAEASLAARRAGQVLGDVRSCCSRISGSFRATAFWLWRRKSAWIWTSSRPIWTPASTKRWSQKDLADGEAAGVYGTPAFYINGKQYNGEVTLAALKPILAAELKGETKEAAAK